MKTKINLNIDELVLPNLPAGHKRQIIAAMEAELDRLITTSGLAERIDSGVNISNLSLDPLNINTQKPVILGAQIARQIFARIDTSQTQPSGGQHASLA